MKFSLLTLLAAVAIAAMGCAALSKPAQGSVMAVFTAAIVLLLSAVLAAVYCKAAARAFWLGFAICGWSYLLLVWVCLERELTPDPSGRVLATAWILDELAEATVEEQSVGSDTITTAQARFANPYAAPSAPATRAYGPSRLRQPASPVPSPRYTLQPYAAYPGTPEMSAWRCLLQIGHALWALLFAFAGGVLARWLYTRQERQVHP